MSKLKNLIRSFFCDRERFDRLNQQAATTDIKIDELRQQIATLQSDKENKIILYSLSEKVDALLMKANALIAASPESAIIREVDRLDSYLEYHSSKLRELIEARTSVLYSAPSTDAIVKTGGFDLVVPSQEIGLLAYLTRHDLETIEPGVRAALRRHIKPGGAVVDGGTNIGAHSVVMAQAVGPNGRFIGFEALPHLADAVRKSLNLNGLSSQSTIVQAALTDKAGDLSFFAADHSPYSSMFSLDDTNSKSITVKATTLDEAVEPAIVVDLIKLDIEGAEPLAWKGMSRIVSANPNLILIMEWSASHFQRSGNNACDFMRQIQGHGFFAWTLNDRAPESPKSIGVEAAGSIEGANIIFSRNQNLYP